MNAFFKTLFGDLYNLGFVAAVVALTALLVHVGLAKDAAFIMPATLLLGAAVFARR
ncbi:MAG: hypothetical protein KGO02_09820 [Alphaproteobacteria bacterium]|nr:hypothetical protein [Alphaproteobacteria bacterium]